MLSLLLTACSPSDNEDTLFSAWDFTLDSLDNQTYTLSDLHGQWVLVNFWATWCVPCQAEMPALQTLYTQYGVLVLGINQRESVGTVQPFITELGITFPILMNPTDQTLVDYSVVGLPQSILVDPTGMVVLRQFGPINLQDIVDLIQSPS